MKAIEKTELKQIRESLVAIREATNALHNTHQVELQDLFFEIAKDNVRGMTVDEVRGYIEREAIPEHGSVSGLAYYSEIKEIGAVFIDEIFMAFYEERIELPTPADGPQALSFIVWKAWELLILGNEEVADRLISELNPPE